MVFDAETKSVLHTEMAKKNLFVKRGYLFFYRFLFSQFFGMLKVVARDCLSVPFITYLLVFESRGIPTFAGLITSHAFLIPSMCL